jgi:hypothetical protein
MVLFGFGLIMGAQASGAQVDLLHLAFDHDGSRMNIGSKGPVGMAFRMADILAEHRCFSANFTLQGKSSL